jgi:hypothetical protein
MGIAALIFGLAIGAALVILRFRREPKWAGPLRILVAVLVVWMALMSWESHDRVARMRAKAAAGDTHAWDYDTGGGAAIFLVGWVPALAYTGVLSGLRWGVAKFKRHAATTA